MGRLVETTLLSADGGVGNPQHWAMRYFDSDAQKDALELLKASDAMLLGRVTCQALAAGWSGQTGAFADRINAMPKYVVSSTLQEAAWENSQLVRGDALATVRELKARHDGDLVIYGHGQLTQALLDGGLIDEIRFNLHPVLAGRTVPRLQARSLAPLSFVGSRVRPSGVVVLSYRPLC